MSGTSRLMRALPVAVGGFGGILVLIGTGSFGSAVTPDSANYVAAASSLLAGEGFLTFEGAPLTRWPPLYPTLLALGRVVDADPAQAAPILNAIVFSILVICTGRLLFSHLRDRHLAWIGLLAVTFSWPLLHVAMKIWSEMTFALIALLFVTYVPTLLTRPSAFRLVVLAGLAALAALQRYAGLVLVPVGLVAIVLWMKRASLSRRIRYAVVFVVISVTPLLLWLIRNYLLTETVTGGRTVSDDLLIGATLEHFVGTLTTWLVPPMLPLWAGLVTVSVVCVIVLAGFRAPIEIASEATGLQDRVMLLFVGAYAALVVGSSVVEAANLPDNRLLSPLYVPLVYLVAVGIERAVVWGSGRVKCGIVLKRTVAALFAVWLIYPVVSGLAYTYIRASHDTNVWHKSDLANWLEGNPPSARLYSNQAWVVYLSTGTHTTELPPTDLAAYIAGELVDRSPSCAIAWFYDARRGKDHASALLFDFFGRIPGAAQGSTAGGLSRGAVEFMERSGVTRREELGPAPLDETSRSPAPASGIRVSRQFDDGIVYDCASEDGLDSSRSH